VTRKTVVFTDFARGEYGALSPFDVGFRPGTNIYSGYWTGQNVVRNITGELMPRAGEKAYTLTGVPNGALGGMGYGLAGNNHYLWFAVGTAVYRFTLTNFAAQAVVAYAGALGAYTEPLQSANWNDLTQLFAYPAGQYRLDHTGNAVTFNAAGPQAFNCAIYGDRLVAGSANTLYYSKAGDWDTWAAPDGGTITVGDAFNINAVRPLRNRLALAKAGSPNGHWYVLSGVPGYNHVLRHAETGVTPHHHENSCDMGSGVGYVSQSEGCLCVFDGTQVNVWPHLKPMASTATGIPTQTSSFELRRRGEWGFVVDHTEDNLASATGSMWLFRNGAWTYHTRSAVASGGVNTGGYSVTVPDSSRVVFGQGGDASHQAKFVAFNPYLERPPFSSDTGVTVLDPAVCTFTLPEWWTPAGEEVAVKKVIVDFRKWNTGDSNPNTMTVTPTPLRQWANPPDGTGGSDGTAGTSTAFSEATTAASTSGTRARLVADVAPDWGNGFRVTVSNLRGVAVQKVVVVYDTRPMAGV
jgi:hypothetical protein